MIINNKILNTDADLMQIADAMDLVCSSHRLT